MGLDNGMILHTKRPIDTPPELNLEIDVYNNEDFSFEYGIFYFRKCWNIRRVIAYVLGASVEYCGKAWLDINEVKGIWRALNDINSQKAWDESESIWSYSEIKDSLNQSLLALEWLISFMREHQDVNDFMVEFYDSY